MSNYLHQFIFGIYPYIALAIFFLGSLIRFDREQYTWKSDSSQLLHRGSLRLGNILFHIGIIGLLRPCGRLAHPRLGVGYLGRVA